MNIHNKKIVTIFFVFIIIIFGFAVSKTIALSGDTHSNINKYIAQGLYLDNYLKNQLGMPEGKDTFFENKKVFDLVADGGAYEDQPPRWMAHFHNPLTNKGLLGSASALAWAIAPAGAQTTFPPTGTGTYSWYDARSYFEQALISKDKKTRENYFALAFRSIGQVMHVVQDMSVPAHTRGDIHPSLLNIGGDDYEKWAKKNIKGVTQGSAYSPYNNSMFLIPQLFDTDQYNGTNPSITISNSIGLAEFTNANFMSADTIFKDFDYPNKSNLQMYPKEVSPGKWAVYYTKTIDGLGEVKHFVREKSYYDKLPTSEAFRGLMLDDSVNSDYAQHLIPRAVGYSAQVLQYFFRGQLEAEFVEGNLKVKNTSSETISNGEFSLYYDNASEERNLLVTAQADNLPSGSEQTITIPEIPEGATSFMLVYKGKLGNEENAVIGKVIPSEFVVITVSLSGISGENLTKKTVFVWNPASNSLVRAPIDNADTNFQAWRENRTVTGNTLFGPLQECGTKVGFGADNLTDRCDVIKKGLVDTSVNNGYSYYVPKSWNPPVEEHYVFVYDYESMNHAVSGFWELGMTGISAFVYPKSFYCAVFLPQNQNNFSGLRTSRWRKITGISTAGDSVLNYPYTGDTHEEWIDTFVGPLGTMGEFRGYRDYEFSTHDYYHEDKYYIPEWNIYTMFSGYQCSVGNDTCNIYFENKRIAYRVYGKPITVNEEDVYMNARQWFYTDIKGVFNDQVIANVCVVQYVAGTVFNYSNQPRSTTMDARTILVQAQALYVPQGTTGYDWVSAGRNAELESQIIAAINMAYSLNGIAENEIRQTTINIEIVK